MRALSRTLLATTALGLALAGLPAASASAPPAGSAPATAEQDYDATRLLVAFQPGTPAAERSRAHAAHGARVENRMEWLDLDVVRLPEGQDAADVAPRYERNPNVAYTDLNHRFRVASTPDDVLFEDEWGLHNTGQSVTASFVRGKADVDIDAPEGWTAAFGAGAFPSSGGARVGILDTGIDLAHPDLVLKTKACASATSSTGIVVNGACSDDNLHGTHVAGTIGAATGNTAGVAGVAPNAEFAVFKGLDAAGFGFYADIVAGIHWLHTTGGAKIISMSIGGPRDDALDKELTEAAAAGVLLIAAAGNDGDSTANYPAAHRDVVSVAAVDAAGDRADFSNCNGDVEIAAPGVDVWSTLPGGTYGPLSGTSMATPHVSGVAAMVAWKKGLDAGSTRTLLKSSAQGSGGCNSVGIVNLASALSGGGGGGTTEPTPVGVGTITGTVSDASSKAGLSGATVDCGSAGTATTGSGGAYTLSSVPASSYSCTASATGYKSKTSTVTVTADTTTRADFALRASR